MIALRIGLSAESIIDMSPAAQHQLDKPATRFVATVLQDIDWRRKDAEREQATLSHFKRLADERPGSAFEQYRNVTLEEFWRQHCPAWPEALAYLELPPLTKDRTDQKITLIFNCAGGATIRAYMIGDSVQREFRPRMTLAQRSP